MLPFDEVTARLRLAEAGRRAVVQTPFGRRLLTYADQTATGRSLSFVEAALAGVRPLYANTHTAISTTGRVMTRLREEARAAIAAAVHAGPDDVVLFTGSGATAAVNKLVGLLGLRIDEPLDRRYRLSERIPAAERPVVLVSPYEHHSNELPWIESVAEVVEVALGADGRLDLGDLDAKARAFAGRPLKIGAFSAASNVTGALTDVGAVARTLHAHGFLACGDYAAAAPYVPIDMHPADPAERLDALFVSTHKFLGGSEGSGLLVAHRDLFRSRVPERPGGGTVDYVAAFEKLSVDYTTHLAEREEGGTPDILGDLRAGLAFQVKAAAGPERILAHDLALGARAVERLRHHPRLRLYGPAGPRLPILSFNIDGLHHDLASVLLDHLFGIQNRAGCGCAGPYGHKLLGVGAERSALHRKAIAAGTLALKPGWVRLSLPWYATPEEVEFLLAAVEFLADHGEAFVPLYRLGWRDGVWHHVDGEPADPVPLTFDPAALLEAAEGRAPWATYEVPLDDAAAALERGRYLSEARALAASLEARWKAAPPRWNPPSGDAFVDGMVWFKYVHAG
jgi:selenocysteine lyase/cysteine desulfurase